MSKRRRDDESDDPNIEDRNLALQVSRLRAKTGQGIKSLHEALKLARGFERQKLGRRQKNARQEPQILLRLREEVIVLKQLQLDKTARSRLLKNLRKTKRIGEHPAFIKAYGAAPVLEQGKSGAETNVLGRLFNAKPVKQALSETMKSIYDVLKIPQVVSIKLDGKDSSTHESLRSRGSATPKDEIGKSVDDATANREDARLEQLSASEFDDDALVRDTRGRLASSDEESDNSGVDFEGIPQAMKANQNHFDGRLNRRADLSLSSSDSDASESDGAGLPSLPQLREDPTRTAFLPSLSMGGYYSGSESEDDTNQYQGPALPKPRKNRRGQRARQQLAELKYGPRAKHLEKKQSQDEKTSGWDAKRGAVDQSANLRRHFRNAKVDHKRGDDRSKARMVRTSKGDKPKSKDDQGPIHPSWEAAKKRKMQGPTQASFEGKKTTFD
jgi:hypothetical protein